MCSTKHLEKWPRAGGPVELSYAKGSIQETARELGVDPGRISKWRQRHKKTDQNQPVNSTLTDEQQQIRRLQRELREAQMDRTAEAARYTKEGGQHAMPGIFSKTDGKYSDL